MTMVRPLASLGRRNERDRLELLQALMGAPSFDPLYRDDVITIPRGHPVYLWWCAVPGCEQSRAQNTNYCQSHVRAWRAHLAELGEDVATKATFLNVAEPLTREGSEPVEPQICRICLVRPAFNQRRSLCSRHLDKWVSYNARVRPEDKFDEWVRDQVAYEGYGTCRAAACDRLAHSPLTLCLFHDRAYRKAGSPGDATLPRLWVRHYEAHHKPVPVSIKDEAAFTSWCAKAEPACHFSQINLVRIRPLAKSEIQWGLDNHGRQKEHTNWMLYWVRMLAKACRESDVNSLADLDLKTVSHTVRMVAGEILNRLRPIYYTKDDSRDAGFIETEHFGKRFPGSETFFDLTQIRQRWLRDMVWRDMAARLEDVDGPRSRAPFDSLRRCGQELGAFLEIDAPASGHKPELLFKEHVDRFVADQRHRARYGQPSLAMKLSDGTPSKVSDTTCRIVFGGLRRMMRDATDSGRADALGLDRSFVTAFPVPRGAKAGTRKRHPFSDQVARALAAEENLSVLSSEHDPFDRGIRDVWEALAFTGRRCSEVIQLRLDCIERFDGVPILWHDQTKVGNFDAAIRIPERLYELLDARRGKTLRQFRQRHGRNPTAKERRTIALFPSRVRNSDGTRSISYGFFNHAFRAWVESMDFGGVVAHMARHTLATKLLRAGANLSQIRRYLGQVSDRMAEHYIEISTSELDDVLARVWVAGPGSMNPGESILGAPEPMAPKLALAMAVDVSRRCTPTLGGICTAQVVVDGGQCPRNLDCESCDKLVLTGADLLYWRRKREQWYSIAERAPDDATAKYLHDVFAPTALAIDGLERALASIGLLEQALAMDLRRPQDFFAQVWNLGFPVPALIPPSTNDDYENGHGDVDGFGTEDLAEPLEDEPPA